MAEAFSRRAAVAPLNCGCGSLTHRTLPVLVCPGAQAIRRATACRASSAVLSSRGVLRPPLDARRVGRWQLSNTCTAASRGSINTMSSAAGVGGAARVAASSGLPLAPSAPTLHAQTCVDSYVGSPQQQQRGGAQHAAVAALAAPVPGFGLQTPNRWSLLLPGVVLGAIIAVAVQYAAAWVSRFSWVRALMDTLDMGPSTPPQPDAFRRTRSTSPAAGLDGSAMAAFIASGASAGPSARVTVPDTPEARRGVSSLAESLLAQPQDQGESVEWVNMCLRKAWRVYQRGLERWITDLLQPVFDGLVRDGSVPRFVPRLRIVEFTLDHEAPYFSNMRRRYSRKDSDLTGVVDLRYTGGARMLLLMEVGGGRWRFKVPVLVSDLDVDCQMWIKIRLAPLCPWIGSLSLAFVGPPNVKVQLSPYNRVRLMRVPVVQSFLRKLLTVDVPGLMVLPRRLEVAIPPSVTSVAEAAVGRDVIMRAVASAVLQADAVEQALLAALPLGPQTPAGGISLPEAFQGELDVVLKEARDLPVWGFPGQSNPYVRLVLGEQAVQSRRDDDTGSPGRHRHPVWNQEFQFLVEAPDTQMLQVSVRDSHLTGRVEVGSVAVPLADISRKGERVSMWLPLTPPPAYATRDNETRGEVLLEISYKAFVEEYDERDSGYREARAFQRSIGQPAEEAGGMGGERITDIRSAAAASSRAAVAASAAISAIAMTKAAAARAATRAARAAQAAAEQAVAVAGLPKPSPSPPPPPPPPPLPPPPPGFQPTSTASDVDEWEDGMGLGIASVVSHHEGVLQHLGTTTRNETTTSTTSTTMLAGAVTGGTSSRAPHSSGGDQAPGSAPSAAGRPAAVPTPAHRLTTLEHVRHREHTAGLPVREPLSLSAPRAGVRQGSPPLAPPSPPAPAPNPAVADVEEQLLLESLDQLVHRAQEVERQLGQEGGNVTGTQTLFGGSGSPGPTAQQSNGQVLTNTTTTVVTTTQTTTTLLEVTPAVAAQLALPPPRAQAGIDVEPGVFTDVPQALAPQLQQPPGDGRAGNVLLSDSSDASATPAAGWQEPSGATSSLDTWDGAAEEWTTLGHPAEGFSALDAETPPPARPPLAPPAQGPGAATTAAGAKGVAAEGGSTPTQPQPWPHQHPPLPLVLNRVHDLGMAMGSMLGKARDTLAPSKEGDSGGQETDGTAKQAGDSSSSSSSSNNDSSWLAPVLAALSVLTSSIPATSKGQQDQASQPPAVADTDVDAKDAGAEEAAQAQVGAGGGRPWWQFWGGGRGSGEPGGPSSGDSQAGSEATANAAGAEGQAQAAQQREAGSGDDSGRPWWQFWGRGAQPPPSTETDSKDRAAGEAAGPQEEQQQQQPAASGGGRPWWQFWGGGGPDKSTDSGEGSGDGRSEHGPKPVESVVIPADLPLEEIAKEVAKLKDESWRNKGERVETLWARAVERNDRPWLILCAALLGVAVTLLAAVAWRLDHLAGGAAETDVTVPLATLQLLMMIMMAAGR